MSKHALLFYLVVLVLTECMCLHVYVGWSGGLFVFSYPFCFLIQSVRVYVYEAHEARPMRPMYP
jgi:hypothetical protein